MPQYYVEGSIYDNNGEPLRGVTIQLVVNATGKAITQPLKLEDQTYSAWSETNPYEIGVVFTAPGFQKLKVQMSTLQTNSDVTMQRGTDPVTIPIGAILLVIAAVSVYRKQSKKVGKLETKDVLPIMVIVGGVLGFTVIKKILESLGIWKSKDSKDLDNASTDPNAWWNPNFWKSKPANESYTNPITTTTARNLASTIFNSFSWYNDNEEQAISVFKTLPSRAAGSFLSDTFRQEYDQDLLTFLRGGNWPQDRLSDFDVNTINNYVNSLPKY